MTAMLLVALAVGADLEIRQPTPREEVGFALCEAAFKASKPVYGREAKELKISYDYGETLTCRKNENVLHKRTSRPVQGKKSP